MAWRHLRRERRGYRARDFGLHGEDVVQRAVESLRPAAEARASVDQVGRDACDVARAAQRAIEQVVHAEFLGDGHGVIGAVAEFGGRRLRHDLQLQVACQRRAQFLGQSVRKIVLARVTAQVLERQHRHAVAGGRPRPRRSSQPLRQASQPATPATAVPLAVSSSARRDSLARGWRSAGVGAGGRAWGSPIAAAVGARPMTAATPRTMVIDLRRIGFAVPAAAGPRTGTGGS